jgi:hypothetical protein
MKDPMEGTWISPSCDPGSVPDCGPGCFVWFSLEPFSIVPALPELRSAWQQDGRMGFTRAQCAIAWMTTHRNVLDPDRAMQVAAVSEKGWGFEQVIYLYLPSV